MLAIGLDIKSPDISVPVFMDYRSGLVPVVGQPGVPGIVLVQQPGFLIGQPSLFMPISPFSTWLLPTKPVHADLLLRAGDDWAIPAQLFDTQGKPLDLSAATIEWVLIGPAGDVAIAPSQIEINPVGNGFIDVIVPSEITRGLPPGYYTDALRVTIDEDSTVMWSGPVAVSADPFDFFDETLLELSSPAFQILQPAIGVPQLTVVP